jgi:ribose 5-phosphate isomerase A
MTVEALKRAAAVRAVEEIRSGMVVGLGSGSTAELAVEALGLRIESGLAIVGVPTSERTRALAEKFRIPLAPPNDWPRIDLTIDGADQVERGTLSLIKGLGVATPLPVEIVPFGAPSTLDRLAALGLGPKLRQVAGKPFVTDGGNHIADCATPRIDDAVRLEAELSAIVGVIETGLFLGLASMVVVGRDSGIEVMKR